MHYRAEVWQGSTQITRSAIKHLFFFKNKSLRDRTEKTQKGLTTLRWISAVVSAAIRIGFTCSRFEPEGKGLFNSHHDAGGNETTSVVYWDGLSCKRLRLSTRCFMPQEPVIVVRWVALTITLDLIKVGLHPLGRLASRSRNVCHFFPFMIPLTGKRERWGHIGQEAHDRSC